MTLQNTKSLKKQIAPFEQSTTKQSIWQIINTLGPFIILWYLAYISLSVSYWLALIPAVFAAGFLTRIFIIFHDCTHHSFFKDRRANRIVGTIMGVLTLFPFDQWGHEHSVHHATSGNLDKRGTGDIWTLTVDEYLAAPFKLRFAYRFYRNPLVMFGLGPIYVFLLKNRFNRKGARKKEKNNTYLTNVLIVVFAALLCLAVGWQSFLLVQGSIFMISGSIGIWLFYVQHTFEDSYFEENEEWEYVLAAVEGSSFYKLPKLMQFLTGNIGYHHVHHLSPRVPNYKLEMAHNNTQPLENVPTITLATSLRSLRFRLWDEESKNFVGFKDIKYLTKKSVPTQVKSEL
ncbi:MULTISPECIES: fatty acid desaturase [Peribacillus]|jgi:acyl-lipid omega-6 desaturase (Delta-12 desaturase)|uniref:fatty acid desaturase n=1 Tax=Peribacillus TaxID=2675229 RepID=UPI000708C09A|nr:MULTISPECIES: fatty acid desaturase [Peribacillus]KRF58450.1 fatty acid desaturase [Bacillus sp. Soil745]MBD8135958.1 fatty acid desaturase [Bacillus sp. CFBP 13597]PAW28976.1 fatty acid desaturase [Peribacillus simplex]PEF40708.1 fatty acid desaturase [Bacillus sp. AFS094228]PEO50406.1 fatty acid desaturase [Bacillus sp. AFS026049]PHD71532.1 fatty acid desaturase [Bacillus sp. AFS043905]PRS26282.1 fatty acid desaturase [Bacillus sp. RJGP41]QNK48825.1 fatty acid desaturase [Brevibacteriu